MRDFPGSPVVKTSPSNAGGAVQSHMPSGQKNQNMKQRQFCNNSIKIKKKKKGQSYEIQGVEILFLPRPSIDH